MSTQRRMLLVKVLVLSLVLLLVGAAAYTGLPRGSETASGAGHSQHAAAAADTAVKPLPEGLSHLAQPVVAPPVGDRGPELVKFDLEATEVTALLDDGVAYTYWTFNKTVPGPMMRVRVGDTVQITLKNSLDSKAGHSIDLHAVTGPGGGATHTQVKPGSSATIQFKALQPGTYVYHCATPPVELHIANGMYGMIVVEPEGGLPAVDHEYYVMQGDYYLSGERGEQGLHGYDMKKMLAENPDYIVFNGAVGSLMGDNALQAEVGDKVRIFFGVGGPNITSSFHVIGGIFDRVAVEGGSLWNEHVQTTMVPAGGATIAEMTLPVPGNYLLVDHSLSRATKGAAGMIQVTGPENPDIYQVIQHGDAGSGGH